MTVSGIVAVGRTAMFYILDDSVLIREIDQQIFISHSVSNLRTVSENPFSLRAPEIYSSRVKALSAASSPSSRIEKGAANVWPPHSIPHQT